MPAVCVEVGAYALRAYALRTYALLAYARVRCGCAEKNSVQLLGKGLLFTFGVCLDPDGP